MWVLGIAATFCGLFLLPGENSQRPAAWARLCAANPVLPV
ncbi:LYPD1 isoform 3 [Pan troglodytes]|uniref:LYPD1 isoform 3 n=1 Tax=Pan troglodytes TaxID=9598 RepID=A0A2J8PNV0_PANTR|nr:LYPD1 isoform 3 [Pan troglodytes]